MTLELKAPIRAALIGNSTITADLGTWTNSPAIHTRRPVPDDTGYPCIVVSANISRGDQDGVNDFRPVVVIDVTTYGKASDDYRQVETVANRIYDLFHRQRDSISVTGYSVTEITCTGPIVAPADGDDFVARSVTLTISLRNIS